MIIPGIQNDPIVYQMDITEGIKYAIIIESTPENNIPAIVYIFIFSILNSLPNLVIKSLEIVVALKNRKLLEVDIIVANIAA